MRAKPRIHRIRAKAPDSVEMQPAMRCRNRFNCSLRTGTGVDGAGSYCVLQIIRYIAVFKGRGHTLTKALVVAIHAVMRLTAKPPCSDHFAKQRTRTVL